MNDIYDSVLKQLQSAGLLIDSFDADTKGIIRCKAEGDSGKKRSGWYRVYSVTSKKGNIYYVGSYGNWKNTALPEKGVTIEYEGSGLTEEDRELIQKKQQQAQKAADAERKKKSSEAAKRARGIWEKLPTEGSSGYLARKKVAGFGLRYSRGSIIVPVRKVSSELVGLQFINEDGSKKFLTGTPKSGAFHTIGALEPESTIVVAEGYATAASIHMATGLPVLIAFDAGNLVKVSKELHSTYPACTIVIAADNDTAGLKYAHKAISHTSALLAVPNFSEAPLESAQADTKLSDFNDLHCLFGLEIVKQQILAACPPLSDQSTKELPEPPAPTEQFDEQPQTGYVVGESGVFWIDPNGDDGQTRYRICGRLDVLAFARTADGREWGLMLEFNNFDNERCEWFVPMRLFAAERGSKVLEGLLDRGLEIDPHRNSKNRLMDYLQRAKPTKRMRLINKLGWAGGAYVSPLRVIGTPEEPLHYYVDRKLLNRSGIAGSIDAWRENVSQYCIGNPLLTFAVSVPFAGPLLEWLGFKTMGFHMVGPSSLGKSTLSTVAGSVCGGVDYFRTWNTTAAALESTAAEHSDSILILDEINQADPMTVGQTVYQLGNEEGRARATDTGGSNRTQHTWKLVWLSNGERSLKEIQSRVGKVTEAGMEMRLLHVRADLHSDQSERDTKGIYQELHDFAHGAALSEHLKREVAKNHGHAFELFIEWLTSATDEDRKKLVSYLHRRLQSFEHNNLSENASGQARRAAMGFALVGECGELASRQGITGWPTGEARKAAAALFKNFLIDRGGEGNSEDRAILEQICLELQTKGESHFTRWDRSEPTVDTHQPRSMSRWGFRRVEDSVSYEEGSSSEEEYYIFKEVFRKELCKGLSYKRACELLKAKGALVTSKNKGFLYQKVLPGTGKRQTLVYFIKMSALQELLPENEKLEI